MESTTVKNDEIPLESRFNFYVTVILATTVGVCGFVLLCICDTDLFPPEIVLTFWLILLYTFLQDIAFLCTTRCSGVLCLKNAFFLIALLTYFYSNSKLWSLTLNTVLACVVVSGTYCLIQGEIHAKCERKERLMNKEVFTLNSGSMLAYGFYYGYLKLILPSGHGRKGVKEKIQDYIDRHAGDNQQFREMFPVKKLFVLIPSSSFSYDELDFGSGMEPAQPLEVHEENRALTRERVYKNTVYLVKNEAATKKYFVLPEIATPTKTLYETCKEQKHVAKFKEEIVTSFYHTLQKLLDDDPTCGTVCELIYYKDSGKSSDRVNLADIIIKRVEKIKREEKLKTS